MPAHGRYRVVRKIADGGMAEIFLATQHGAEGFQRPVVLKRILATLLADPKFRNMLIDEAHVAMGLNHSNIVQVLDLGHSKGRYFLVLELVDGWDLHTILNRVKALDAPIPPQIGLYIVGEICRALAYAHGRARDGHPLGIVHRDVSPHNVLVSEQGEVKLTDFGIAKALGRRERTGHGIIKGKLAFMSPEQASGTTLDARSDLFAVGTILYLIFTGRRPFEAPTDLEIILRVQQGKIRPPREVQPDLPPKVEELILKAMKLAPAERYQSAEEMLIDIEAVQRSVFQPAGQTELKRWLAELAKRDAVVPVSRGNLAAVEGELEVVDDLVEGVDIVFEDDGSPTVQAPPPPRPSTPPLPPPAAPLFAPLTSGGDALLQAQQTAVDAPFDLAPPLAERAPRRSRWKALLLGASALAAFGYVVTKTRDRADVQAPVPTEGSPAPPPPAHTTQPAPAPPVAAERGGLQTPPSPAAEQAAASTEEPPAPQPVPPESLVPASETGALEPPQRATGEASAGGEATTDEPTPNDDEDEDEEALLQRQEADATSMVIGEDVAPAGAVPTATPAPAAAKPDVEKNQESQESQGREERRASKTGKEKQEEKRPRLAAKATPAAEVVSVKVASRPTGAVIKVNDGSRAGRVFGRAPMKLRFRSGITYELTFVKKGYVTTSKRVLVTKRKNQQIAVSLKKKANAPKRRSLFKRWFGG